MCQFLIGTGPSLRIAVIVILKRQFSHLVYDHFRTAEVIGFKVCKIKLSTQGSFSMKVQAWVVQLIIALRM